MNVFALLFTTQKLIAGDFRLKMPQAQPELKKVDIASRSSEAHGLTQDNSTSTSDFSSNSMAVAR